MFCVSSELSEVCSISLFPGDKFTSRVEVRRRPAPLTWRKHFMVELPRSLLSARHKTTLSSASCPYQNIRPRSHDTIETYTQPQTKISQITPGMLDSARKPPKTLQACAPLTYQSYSARLNIVTHFFPITQNSNNAMSSSPSTIDHGANDRVNQPTFLGIPPETRNAIYDYAFSAESKRGLAPHALTRVNRQIRQESLFMEYKSVKTLVICLHNRKQLDHFKQWADAEVNQPNHT